MYIIADKIKYNLYIYVFIFSTFFINNSYSIENKGLFGSIEFKLDSIDAIIKWKNVLNKIKDEEIIFKSCDADIKKCENIPLSSWREFIKNERLRPKNKVLQDVNNFINRWPYIEDSKNWSQSDYWESPLEFLDKSGDCEDFAIIKYVTLKELGGNPDKMRIAVVMDNLRLVYHAVLVVYDNNNQALILDSLFDAVLPHNEVLQYTPHYSVNEKARWAHIMPLLEGK